MTFRRVGSNYVPYHASFNKNKRGRGGVCSRETVRIVDTVHSN